MNIEYFYILNHSIPKFGKIAFVRNLHTWLEDYDLTRGNNMKIMKLPRSDFQSPQNKFFRV